MKKENIFSPLRSQAFTYDGVFADAVSRVCEGTFKKINMTALCDYFAQRADQFATGEFWGKMMRGMCLIATYKKDENLREIIENAAKEMMALQDKDGDISTVPKEKQPRGTHGSDLWERKYVLMGLLAYYELSGNEKALACARDLALYTAKQVGFSPKCSIYDTGWAFYGMESASILEVIMRTFAYTGDDELLAFGQYIIDCGACGRENLFEAIRAGKSPYRIGEGASPKDSIAKAYEMTSCIEGLVAFYNATGSEDALMLAKSYWESVKAEEITLLGSGGADKPHNLGPGIGEQWNRTAFEQTNPDISL
ncbi:MAG: glycoside hydrolase family 127 protein, partial [Clostridia bacterium]|nr:glycoside hydrolase family 127 protein [Clostridia bacterium]